MFDGLFNANYPCPLCNRMHAIRQCTRLLIMNVEQKLRAVAHHGLCSNCLAQTHQRADCKSLDRCRRCVQDHHTALHPTRSGRIWFQMTAEVKIVPYPGCRPMETRIVIDPNAARSSITAAEAERLGCVVTRGRTMVTMFHTRFDKRRIDVNCAVEDRNYGYNPSTRIDREWNRNRNQNAEIAEADKWWFEKYRFFLILGADATKKVLIGAAAGRSGDIYSQETIFGQTYFGEARVAPHNPRLE